FNVDYEQILFFTKNSKYKHNQQRDDNGRITRTTWDIPIRPTKEGHVAAYPTELIEKLVLCSTDAGDTVLDPFNGSGSTGVVALEHGRNYIGIELLDEYVEIS